MGDLRGKVGAMDTTFPSDELLLRAMGIMAWGDLWKTADQGVYPIICSLSTVANPMDRARDLVFVIRVKPHQRMWGQKPVYIQDLEVVQHLSIPERDLYMMSVEDALRQALQKLLSEFPRQVAPRLYEADPRIGTVATVGEGTSLLTGDLAETDKRRGRFIACPLFDPPGGIYLPFPKPPVDFPLAQQHHNRWTRCGQCKTQFILGEEATWGGGYLLWVCRSCLPSGIPATAR